MIKDLRIGTSVRAVFLVREVSFASMKKTGFYAKGVLCDSSGTVAAIQWNVTDAEREIWKPGSPIYIIGKVDEYEGSMQVVVDTVDVPSDSAIDVESLYPVCPIPAEELWKQFMDCLAYANSRAATFDTQCLAEKSIEWVNDDEENFNRFRRSPAATMIHHAYVGGLLEHTVGVMKLARAIAIVRDGSVDPALVIVGAAFHDIGKMLEYRLDGSMTDCGRLWGHSHAGALLVAQNLGSRGISRSVLWLLGHIIASHHGRNEWGAIVEPKTAEAFVVHMADLTDVRLWTLDNATRTSSGWQKIASFGGNVLVDPAKHFSFYSFRKETT